MYVNDVELIFWTNQDFLPKKIFNEKNQILRSAVRQTVLSTT
jgi:hypothetical protein